MRYELSCNYDSRKSFYGKAQVEVNEGTKALYSYGTKVCEIKDGIPRVTWRGYSQTTYRHIREFLLQEGFGKYTKEMIAGLYSYK